MDASRSRRNDRDTAQITAAEARHDVLVQGAEFALHPVEER